MLSVLLATQNAEKASILSRLVAAVAPSQIEFHTPLTQGCHIEPAEFGTVIDRARQKAISHVGCCGAGKDFVIGSDDAFKIPSHFGDEVICDSKRVTDMILSGGLGEGATVLLVRSFWLIDLRTKAHTPARNHNHCVTEIPFRFIAHPGITRSRASRDSYPLSQVLGRTVSDSPVASENADVTDAYYLEHSAGLRAALNELLTKTIR
jgi:hypothetical protein